MKALNGRGMESTPFYLVFSAITLLFAAMIVLPAYDRWQDSVALSNARQEVEMIISAIDAVYLLGDLGSVAMLELKVPDNCTIGFAEDGIELMHGSSVSTYAVDTELRYRGSYNLSGPGEYQLTVVYWPRGDGSNEGKEYLLEVLDNE